MYGYLEGVTKNFQGVLGKFHGCFKSVSQVMQAFQASLNGSFKRVSRIFHKSFKEVSRNF